MSIRAGKQYLEGLKDGRTVRLGGQTVDDVTEHPSLAAPVRTIAGLYDLQHEPGLQAILTREVSGEIIPWSLQSPLTRGDLKNRGSAFKVASDETFGMMGRSPDFVNVLITAFDSAADYFGDLDARFGNNIREYYRWCVQNDKFIVHASINPQTDRSKGSAGQSDPTLHMKVVDRDVNGIVVHGAKMIGTLVPIADELLVFPMPGYRPGDEDYAVAFAIPVNTDGVTIVCREPFGSGSPRNPFDHPLARYDEMDATVVFDNVRVPWNRVFLDGDVAKANRLYPETTGMIHTGHQGIIRGLSKLELLCGIAVELAESANTSTFLHVQEMLGEALSLIEIYKGAVLHAEYSASLSSWGTMTPPIQTIRAIRYHFPRACSRIIEIIQILGGGSLLSTPSYADLTAEDGPELSRYFSGSADFGGDERIHLLKLAWDVSGDGSGQRQSLYERNLAGDPVRLAAAQYLNYDATSVKSAVKRAMETSARDMAIFEL
ncbi:4-hydroxyphenylacetate 3-hydroxylase family protein [Nocardia camponoti]|uniref:4-hydroxyphenylacetate 3-monooxygenase oxygenase component n=1 Tax=Nocardia camponoti TaxID=1616106 RepID=A0A917V486_9NOCA|nr:4-hydroxyphenylacetate 3-hydroxylase N-terminal domain-containing protein [Nocardia camponoti]GGK34332.1 4-hydroxyphenylacetate 3-monooxygenase oxygenase component [Nocardia camponoti]